MENKFINSVSSMIHNKTAKTLIKAELESHILDKADYYMEIGYTEEEALQKATEDMGEAEETAVPFNGLYDYKWYKNLWSVVTMAFVIIVWLLNSNLIPIELRFNYANSLYSISHSSTVDLISLAIFIGFVLLIYKAYRRKNIVASSLLVILLVIIMAGEFAEISMYQPQFSLFQPMLYLVITLLSQGVDGCIDSVFGYAYLPDDLKGFMYIGVYIIFALLLVASVLVWISIFRQQRMKSTKAIKAPIKSAVGVLAMFAVLNTALTIFATTSALVNLDSKLDEMQSTKLEQIHYVINADLSQDAEKYCDELMNNGYEKYYNESNLRQQGVLALHKGNDYNMIMTATTEDAILTDTPSGMLGYASTVFDNFLSFPYSELRLSFSETAHIKSNMTLEEFMSLGWYGKAITVTHRCDSNEDDIEFLFLSEDKYSTVGYSFSKYGSEYILTGESKTGGAYSETVGYTEELAMETYAQYY